MDKNTISKDTMRKLLAVLAEDAILVGPVDNGKAVEYKAADPDDILMDDRISYKSPKEYYFPQVENIITFKDGQVIDGSAAIEGAVIFGCKPCDLEAVRIMKEVFLTGRYQDPYFQKHYDLNSVIGVGCVNEKPGCFCKDIGIDMTFSNCCDILLNDHGNYYSVEHISEKGREILDKLPETKDILGASEKALPAPYTGNASLGLNTALEDGDLFDAIDWEKATEVCQGCGMCTYICPTCHCFEFKDTEKGGQVSRYKCWDSCMYPKFTLHASGHNPRAAKYERCRQRVLHKYLYIHKKHGYTACTGCGRCLRSCPVGMNIKAIVESLMEVTQ